MATKRLLSAKCISKYEKDREVWLWRDEREQAYRQGRRLNPQATSRAEKWGK
jgi:hypothetical protein